VIVKVPRGRTIQQLQQQAGVPSQTARQKFVSQMRRPNSYGKMQWILKHPQATVAEKQAALDWLMSR